MLKSFLIINIIILGIIYLCFKFQSYYQGPKTDHYDGKKFRDPFYDNKKANFSFLKWKLNGDPARWPGRIEIKSYDKPPAKIADSSIRVSMVGHSTVLIQTSNLNILTDPVWSERASPVKFIGPKRVTPPGIKFEDLPKIDVVLVSHNHYDHLDLVTLKQLWDKFQPLIITPLGNESIIHSTDQAIEVKALDWGDSVTYNKLKFNLEYARHWSARNLHDRNKALWGSFVIETPTKKMYFAGDTGYGKHFKELNYKYGNFDLSLIPIGAYKPEWFMQFSHTSPEEAVKAHLDLDSKLSIALHHNTFKLSDEAIEDPAQDLTNSLKQNNLSSNDFKILNAGEFILIK
ncbi:MBL fold metallo-hydrolase [Rickettsiales endosymbiont of Stachyamoeba lipophora]|uniref:MBL fold metallo-hydrolase n=1 Tax=Rickettsiales endosymbiont of Stachyamoeba lipophora TaxID=2486578 RepID=UPI000F648801|nr:MBL fold metallo-hydrolase [Rickettsiales endosymbiont of Stachyamoeba lipophora]AZL15579.1 hypothetical protein EF513_03310 [Rickettsiales endosymbiont of Stachyamoeba lipophora]